MHFDRYPATGSLCDLCGFEAQEAWYGGACKIDVEDSDGMAG